MGKYFYILIFILIQYLLSSSIDNNILKSFDFNNSMNYQYNIPKQNNRIMLMNNFDNDTYILGPGDELHINFISNKFLINNYFIISPSGDLIIPSLGMINLNNLSLIDAILSLKTLFRTKFENYDLNITLSKIREFNVKFIGLPNLPSSYIVNPTTRDSKDT